MNSLNLKRHNSFHNENNGKTTHRFAPRPLIFKLQPEVLKFNNIFCELELLKTDMVINLLNIEN